MGRFRTTRSSTVALSVVLRTWKSYWPPGKAVSRAASLVWVSKKKAEPGIGSVSESTRCGWGAGAAGNSTAGRPPELVSVAKAWKRGRFVGSAPGVAAEVWKYGENLKIPNPDLGRVPVIARDDSAGGSPRSRRWG